MALTVVLAASFVFQVSGASFLGTGIHSVVAQVDSPLFILVLYATARYLRREAVGE